MSVFSFKDLIAPLLPSDLVTSITDVASALGLLPGDWASGDSESVLMQAFSQVVADKWNTFVRPAIRGGFLSLAEGVWLDRKAEDDFNTPRIQATKATGIWTATATASIGPFNIGDVVWYCLDTGETYTNAIPFKMNIGDTLPISIVADLPGTIGNAAPGRVALQHVVLGLSGSNAGVIAGLDAEEDEPLRARCRLKPASLSPNGPANAYLYAALTPEKNGGARVTRTWLSPWSVNGTVTQIFAGPDGALTGDEFAAVSAAVPQAAAPEGVTYIPQNAVNHSIPITYTAYVRAPAGYDAFDQDAAQVRALAALIKHFGSLPINGDIIPPSSTGIVSRGTIAGVIGNAFNDLDGDGKRDTNRCFRVHLDAPTGDVPIAFGEVATLGMITPSVVIVSEPDTSEIEGGA